MTKQKVLVVGTGAMGCLVGSHLAGVGLDVGITGSWRAALDSLEARGIIVHRGLTARSFDVHVVRSPGDYVKSSIPSFGLVFVAVKSWQTNEAMGRALPFLAARSTIVTIQNGAGNAAAIRETVSELGRDGLLDVCAGVTTMGATTLGPGEIRAFGGQVYLPRRPSLEPVSTAVRQAADIRAGVDFAFEDDLRMCGRMMAKLVINCAINPTGALWQLRNGELLANPAARARLHALARETWAIVRNTLPETVDADIFPSSPDDAVALVESVARATADNRCSMLQDVLSSRPTEIASINGYVLRLAQKQGFAAEANRAAVDAMQSKYPGSCLSGARNG